MSVRQEGWDLERWLRSDQPCLFGRSAARRGLLTIRSLRVAPDQVGEAATARRIAEIRAEWNDLMLGGSSLGLVLVLDHPEARPQLPGPQLAVTARALVSAFAGRAVTAAEVVLADVLWPHPGGRHAWRWRVPVNVFVPGLEGSWAHARTMPGGVALVVNSVAQFAVASGGVALPTETDFGKREAWRHAAFDEATRRLAERTIDNCWPAARRLGDPPGSTHFTCGYDVDAAVPAELFGGDAALRRVRTYRFTTSCGQRPPSRAAPDDLRGPPRAPAWQDSDDRACELADLLPRR